MRGLSPYLYELDGELTQKCAAILEKLMKGKHGPLFSSPVEWNAGYLPDYPQYVKCPMDLGTVGRKLECGAYLSADGFARDVGLVLQNAIVFNSWRYAAAQFWRNSAQFAHRPSITSTARTSASTPR